MRKCDAIDLLRGAFGPGDLQNKIIELEDRPANFGDFTMLQAEELIEWIAEQLTDEEDEDGKSGEG